MGIDRSRRITFEEVADLYNETRPIYPDGLIEDIMRLSALKPDSRILEIGCGPGNATVLFAQKGYHLLGIELGERLAAYARARCKTFPNAIIVQSAFEDYELPSRTFELALSADAFHWIPPEIGYPKVMNALKATGSIVFFWHVPVDPQTEWSKAIDEIFQQRAPQFENPQQSFTLEWLVDIVRKNYREFCGIEEVTVRVYNWSETLFADQFIDHAARDGSQLATVETAGAMHGNLKGHIQLRIAQLIKLNPAGFDYSMALPMPLGVLFKVHSGEETLEGSYTGDHPALDARGDGEAHIHGTGRILAAAAGFAEYFVEGSERLNDLWRRSMLWKIEAKE